MVVQNKYGGYWHKTRSTVDSGGLSIPCMVSITNMFQPKDKFTTHHTSLCRTRHNRLDEDRRQARVYPRQRFSRISSDRHERHTRVITITMYQIPIARNHQYALMSMFISSHKIMKTPRQGVLQPYQTTHDNIMPGLRMLAFKLWRGMVHSKKFESFLLLQNPIFENIPINP